MAALQEKSAAPKSPSSSSLHKDDASDSPQLEVAKVEDGVDVVVGLVAYHDQDNQPDPMVTKKLLRKLDWHILPLLFTLYTIQFMDKQSLGASSILGIFEDAHLNQNQFNNLASAFYIGYIIFVWPHSWMMQHFPIGKYIALNTFFWSICLALHIACKNYGGLFALRFLLGASEGCITSGMMTIISMFYNRTEIGERIAWTFQCNGIGTIISAMIGFGVSHVNPHAKPARWHWYMIIVSISSFLLSVAFWVWFPDNPTSARFLSEEEKRTLVHHLKDSQNGIETKVWKKYQFIEALKDPKTWIFFFVAGFSNLIGGIGVQYGLILKGFGFTTLEAALLNFPMGMTMIISLTASGVALRRWPNSRSIIALVGLCPGIIAPILLMTLPWSSKPALLACFYIQGFGAVGFITVVSWIAVTSAGHTKKMTVNAVMLVGYALGQTLAPQFWKAKYAPRYYIPWGIILMTYSVDIVLVCVLRFYFNALNKRRDAIKAETGEEYEEFGYVERTREDGSIERFKVPVALLDITDKENKAFRYVL